MEGRGERISEFKASLIYRERVAGQPGLLHRETLSQKTQKRKRKLNLCSFFDFTFFPDIKMKVTMPYVTWRAVGRSSRRRKPRGELETVCCVETSQKPAAAGL